MTIDTAPLSLAEYARLDDPEHEHRTELVRGTVVREPRPSHAHGRIQVRLASRLEEWTRGRRAEVTVESGYVLAEEPATVRGPDVAVMVERGQEPAGPGGWVRGAPDLAAEVLSPSDTSSGVQRKVLDYLESGSRLVWIVDPEARTVLVHRPDGSARLLRGGDTLEGEDVLPGFAVAVDELFALG